MHKDPPVLQSLYRRSVQALQAGDKAVALRLADELVRSSGQDDAAVRWAMVVRIEIGRVPDAIELGREHLAERNAPSIAGLLGHAYERIGNLLRAEKWFEVATRGEPLNATWLYHRAAALIQLQRKFEALTLLRRAVEIAPEASALLQLAELELGFNDPNEAVRVADQAIALNAADPAAQTLAARALSQMGRMEEAEERWTRAFACGAHRDKIILSKAKTWVELGDFGSATEYLLDKLEEPGLILGYPLYAESKRIDEDDRWIVRRMESLLSGTVVDGQERASLHYALGKSYGDLQEFEVSMRHFDEGNRIEREPIERAGGFARKGFMAGLELRRSVYCKEAVRSLSLEGDPTELPVFVVGMIRSGTTLAERILSSHPMASGAGEQEHWLGVEPDLIKQAGKELDLNVLRDQARIYLKLLARFAEGALRVVDKQPGNMALTGPLHIAFPNARIIHIKRQAVDTAISIWTTRMNTSVGFVHDKANVVFAYREYMKLMAHWREVLPPDRFLEIRYEDLVRDRERTARQMVEFCGLPWSDECLTPERNQGRVGTPSLWQVRQPIHDRSIDRWKNYEPWLGEFKDLLGE